MVAELIECFFFYLVEVLFSMSLIEIDVRAQPGGATMATAELLVK